MNYDFNQKKNPIFKKYINKDSFYINEIKLNKGDGSSNYSLLTKNSYNLYALLDKFNEYFENSFKYIV